MGNLVVIHRNETLSAEGLSFTNESGGHLIIENGNDLCFANVHVHREALDTVSRSETPASPE